jgi:hypothetical protein
MTETLKQHVTWKVQLTGDDLELKVCSKKYIDEECLIEKEGSTYYLLSVQFNSLGSLTAIKKKADQIVTNINARAKLREPKWQSIKTGSVDAVQADGSRNVSLFVKPIHTEARVSALATVVGFDGKVKEEEVSQTEILSKTIYDENISKVLQLIEHTGFQWAELYNILEIIKDDMRGEKAIVKNGWITKKVLENIERTANCSTTLGVKARHGVQKKDPPKNPMGLRDARIHISALTEKWIDWKIQRS